MASMLFIVAVMGVFDLFANTYQGVRETDRELLEVGRSFTASELQTWRFIVIPYALPYLALGLKLGMARALIGTILAEFYVSPSGLGYMIITFGRRFDMARMFVPVLTFTALGLAFVGAISYVVKRLERWRTA
jgi:NitT/TauT family transport system permease protein